ncbi:MAG: ComEA family DNA-binding protein [Aquabacterium sp.]
MSASAPCPTPVNGAEKPTHFTPWSPTLMFKRFLALLTALLAASAFAAVDVNKASQAELEGVKGIGPAIAGKILDERKKGAFKNWDDMVERVKGVGDGNAAKFSEAGLTVNGQGFKGAVAKPATDAKKAEAKPAKAEEKKAEAKPVAKAEAKPAVAKAEEKKAEAKPMADKKDAKAGAPAASAAAKK